MDLRDYQREAVGAVIQSLRTTKDNPCVELPTGTGKSLVIAALVSDIVTRLNRRVLVLAHVKELVEQNHAKLEILAPELSIGIYSAGLNRRDTDSGVLVAGIQSVYRRGHEIGPFDLVVVDEAHMIPMTGEGMYRTLLADLAELSPHMRVVGMTATPFRLGGGHICREDGILNSICYRKTIYEMIVDGWLSPIRSKAGEKHVDLSGVHVRSGEFKAEEVAQLMDVDDLVKSACTEIIALSADREAVLIFCSSVEHCEHVAATLATMSGCDVGVVTGETPEAERDHLLARVRGDAVMENLLDEARPLKYLCNVNVLTTGFDAPRVDTVVLLRATMSPVLYVQMIGRGTRLSDGKHDCLVLDYGNNIVRHGPVDKVEVQEKAAKEGSGEAPAKECPECREVILAALMVCPNCGHEFERRVNHEAYHSEASILSGQTEDTVYDVLNTYYSAHYKQSDPDAPPSMRVEYEIGVGKYVREWVCPEHFGFAYRKFVRWWSERCSPEIKPPSSVEDAVEMATDGRLAQTYSITVRRVSGEKFDTVIGHELGDMPDCDMEFSQDYDDTDEIPF